MLVYLGVSPDIRMMMLAMAKMLTIPNEMVKFFSNLNNKYIPGPKRWN
jgi:hypothetical protein